MSSLHKATTTIVFRPAKCYIRRVNCRYAAGSCGIFLAALHILEEDLAVYRTGGRHAGAFPERWLPSAFAVLSEPFTDQNRFLNSTLNMVRGRIAQHYAARIATLYAAEGRNVCSPQNRAKIDVVLGRE